ncbi:MAG: hypothetical protein SWO11_08340 [Thermodesulfobacteriota bacterium]|nr:hypothetical protein [Thermodesulfobacteriota bacterium]
MLKNKIIKKIKKCLFERPYFGTSDVRIGSNVQFGKNVVFNCKRVRIGDGVIFNNNIIINSDVFEIGDYATIYDYCFFPGPGILNIGHNFWLGTSSIIDAQGKTIIGNNVGIGAHSQLWTHMKFGDVMYGCRFHSSKPLIIEDDVWFVGHCLVSPVKIGTRSIAMLGSVITKDMKADHVYAGIPAIDITQKVGSQFRFSTIDERVSYMQERLRTFADIYKVHNIDDILKIVTNSEQMSSISKNATIFNVADRTYFKKHTKLEYQFMRFLLPDAKFIPIKKETITK